MSRQLYRGIAATGILTIAVCPAIRSGADNNAADAAGGRVIVFWGPAGDGSAEIIWTAVGVSGGPGDAVFR